MIKLPARPFAIFTSSLGAAVAMSGMLLGCPGGDGGDAGATDTDSGTPDLGNEDAGSTDAGPMIIDAGPPALAWDNFAEDFFSNYCVSCHSPAGQAQADYQIFSVVTTSTRPNSIRCGVAPTQLAGCVGEHPPGWFPIGNGPSPTDDERWDLVEWVDNGCRELEDGPFGC